MEFNKIKDENGTSLASFAELLAAKAKAAGLVSVFVFAAREGEHKGIHTISSINGSVSTALIRLGLEMRAEPIEEQMITPVSAGKPN